MSWLKDFLSPGKAYGKAQDEMRKYYDQAQGYQQPYMQGGINAQGNLFDALNKLLDPAKMQNEWASGYTESPYAKMMEEKSKNLGLDAASSMGLMGSSAGLENIQRGSSEIVAQDRENYLNNLMQKYLSGVGIAQGLYGTGAGAAGNMGQNAMNMGQNMGQLEFGKRQAGGNMFGDLLGTLGGYALGGGTGLLNQAGGMSGIGNYLKGRMGWNS